MWRIFYCFLVPANLSITVPPKYSATGVRRPINIQVNKSVDAVILSAISLEPAIKINNKIYATYLLMSFLVLGCLIVGWPSKQKLTIIKPAVILFVAETTRRLVKRWE